MGNETKGAMPRSNNGADRNSCTLFGNSFEPGGFLSAYMRSCTPLQTGMINTYPSQPCAYHVLQGLT